MKKSLAETHPELAAEWHPTKNGSLKPNDMTAGSNKNVWWYLPYDDPNTGKHFDFEWKSTPNSRTNKGCNCPYLSDRAVWKGYNDLATTHPHLAAEWHPTKNDNLKPDMVTAGSDKKVWWLLPYDDPITSKHFDFEWQARIRHRKNGSKCPYLHKHKYCTLNTLSCDYPELAKEWHPTKNGILTPNDITVGSGKKIWWYLPYDDPKTGKHFDFEWQAKIEHRIKGHSCPYLSNQRIWKGFNDLATTHPELAKEWHPTKNSKLTPNNVSAGSEKKVWWQCSVCGYEWPTAIVNRETGRGCPLCSSSEGEKTIHNLLKSYSINFIKEHSFPDCKYKNLLRFDFAIFDKNNNLVFLIEYDGEQHSDEINLFSKHDPYELRQKRDNIKNQYCKDNYIPLIRISYENSDNIENIVVSELKKYNLI